MSMSENSCPPDFASSLAAARATGTARATGSAKGAPHKLRGQSWETGQSSPRRSMRSASTCTGARQGHGRTTAQVLRATGLPPTERRLLRMGADLPGDGQLLWERPVLGNRPGRVIRQPGRQRRLRHRRLGDCWREELYDGFAEQDQYDFDEILRTFDLDA